MQFVQLTSVVILLAALSNAAPAPVVTTYEYVTVTSVTGDASATSVASVASSTSLD